MHMRTCVRMHTHYDAPEIEGRIGSSGADQGGFLCPRPAPQQVQWPVDGDLAHVMGDSWGQPDGVARSARAGRRERGRGGSCDVCLPSSPCVPPPPPGVLWSHRLGTKKGQPSSTVLTCLLQLPPPGSGTRRPPAYQPAPSCRGGQPATYGGRTSGGRAAAPFRNARGRAVFVADVSPFVPASKAQQQLCANCKSEY